MPMEFHKDAVIIVNARCGDPSCGMLHPNRIACHEAGLILVHDDPHAVGVIIQKQPDQSMWLATILPVFSAGFEDQDDDRLYMIFNDNEDGRHPALTLDGEDLDTLKAAIDKDAIGLHAHFFKDGGANLDAERLSPSDDGDDHEEKGGLEALDPTKMFKA